MENEKIIKQMRVNDEYYELVDEQARNELKELMKNKYIKTFEIEIEDDIRYVMYNTFNFIKEGKMQEGELVLFNGTYFSRYNIRSQEFEVFDLDEKSYAHSQIIDLISDKIETLFDFEITSKKFDTTYKAGEGITIENNVISASVGEGIEIKDNKIGINNLDRYIKYKYKIVKINEENIIDLDDDYYGIEIDFGWNVIINTNFSIYIYFDSHDYYIWYDIPSQKFKTTCDDEELEDGINSLGFINGIDLGGIYESSLSLIIPKEDFERLNGSDIEIGYVDRGYGSPQYIM